MQQPYQLFRRGLALVYRHLHRLDNIPASDGKCLDAPDGGAYLLTDLCLLIAYVIRQSLFLSAVGGCGNGNGVLPLFGKDKRIARLFAVIPRRVDLPTVQLYGCNDFLARGVSRPHVKGSLTPALNRIVGKRSPETRTGSRPCRYCRQNYRDQHQKNTQYDR